MVFQINSEATQRAKSKVTKRILIIDDESHVREVVQVCLEVLRGWQVVLAASGLEGLAVARQEHPDAILLDVMMPGMDGLAVVRHLQQDAALQKIPVILLTAKTQWMAPERWLELKVRGAIAKPFNPLGLPDAIANFLDWELGTR